MHTSRRDILKIVAAGSATSALSVSNALTARAAGNLRVAMVAKGLGITFFESCKIGAEEACKELGNVDLIFTGPNDSTTEGQIQVIDSLIAQHVDAIEISADDQDALVPVCKKAMQRGIKVISFDSAIAPAGRIMHLDPSSVDLIGRRHVQLIAKTINHEGEIAILSSTPQQTSQINWIKVMKDELTKPEYAKMKLVETVYDNNQTDKGYREVQGLFKAYPNLRGIMAPTTIGIVSSSKAVIDSNMVGKVYVTGLGLPSEMVGAVKSGACQSFLLWNTIDLGYTTTMIAAQIAMGKASGAPNTTIKCGRMGDIKIGPDGDAAMAEPFIFDASNIDKFSKLF
jgi:rhamnose transport system substrate-binding protein